MQILCISVGPFTRPWVRLHTGTLWSILKADKERGCTHTVVCKKSSEPVQNRSKIWVVQKSEPEIGPVRKRTVPFSYEQKKQVQFRSTFRTCCVSTGTRKCISPTKLVTLSQYIRETLFLCQCF